jgi:alpha-beta hydrolase superfamily lysophospholipase
MTFSAKAGLARDLPPPRWLLDAAGRRLAFSAYPAQSPWLHVLISHGFGEHRGWWQHVALAFQAQGISAYTFDHFHHGMSDGVAADVADYAVLAGGLRLALTQGVEPARAGLPVVLLAHSNGALAALKALAGPADGFAGLVLSSPLLGMPWLTVLYGWPLARLLSLRDPGTFWPLKPRPALLTGDRSLWNGYLEDPYRFRRISVRFFLAMVRETRAAARQASCQGLPLLLVSGGKDRVASLSAMDRWYQRVASPDKRLIRYPDLQHEVFNEAAWPEVFEAVVSWLKARWAPRS